MKKFKVVFYIIFFGFILASVYFAVYTDEMFKQFGMFSFLKFLKYWGALGLLILLVEWIVENIHLFQLRRRNKKLGKEVMALKSELYEVQKKVISGNPPPASSGPDSALLSPPETPTPASPEDTKNDPE